MESRPQREKRPRRNETRAGHALGYRRGPVHYQHPPFTAKTSGERGGGRRAQTEREERVIHPTIMATIAKSGTRAKLKASDQSTELRERVWSPFKTSLTYGGVAENQPWKKPPKGRKTAEPQRDKANDLPGWCAASRLEPSKYVPALPHGFFAFYQFAHEPGLDKVGTVIRGLNSFGWFRGRFVHKPNAFAVLYRTF